MSTVAAIGALCLWQFRNWMRALRWATVVVYIVLDMVMIDPAYYVIARLDVSGSSTGWHRARLIEMSLSHLNEWWFAGTDFTRHWMPTGVSWSRNHTDITNHYLHMGVEGGLPLMFLFIGLLAICFSYVGRQVHSTNLRKQDRFLLWTLGSALFAHAATFISVSYFDQSLMFLYLTLAAVGSGCHQTLQDNTSTVYVARWPGRSEKRSKQITRTTPQRERTDLGYTPLVVKSNGSSTLIRSAPAPVRYREP
jgi:hypothetical protein